MKDPGAAGKDAAELRWESALLQFFSEQLSRVKLRLDKILPKRKAVGDLGKRFWADEEKALLAVIYSLLREDATAGALAAAAEIERVLAISFDWSVANADAVAWAREHAAELVKDVVQTTKDGLKQTVAAWMEEPGAQVRELYNELEGLYYFSPSRAQAIGVTEVTQAYAEGQLAVGRQSEAEGLFTMRKVWHTVRDELVCPICSALDGQTADGIDSDNWTGVGFGPPAPPAHPRCRCWITTEAAYE